MQLETVFVLSIFTVLPFWILMIVAPNWDWTRTIIGSPLIALGPAFLYIVFVVPDLLATFQTAAAPTLANMQALLSTERGTLLAWVHFLAFDLLVGRWAYLDSRERGISAWRMAPVLFFTFTLGPLGYFLYLILRSLLQRVERAIEAEKQQAAEQAKQEKRANRRNPANARRERRRGKK